MTPDQAFEMEMLMAWLRRFAKPMPVFPTPKTYNTPFAKEWAKRFPNQRS